MKHFDITEWSDFNRGVVPAADLAQMESHLSSGCGPCGSTLDFVQDVLAVAQRSSREEPSADAVRWAKALMAMHQPTRAHAPSLIARLVFDSIHDPLPAGTRSVDPALRYAVYVAGNFCIDLHFQEDVEARTATILGQMTDRETPDRPMNGRPVLLVSGKRIVAHCISNKFGEFSLHCNPERRLRLLVGIDEYRERIEVPLGAFVGSEPKTSVRPRRK